MSVAVRWGLVVIAVIALVLVPFAVVGPSFEAAQEARLTEATDTLTVAGLCFGLLALDIVLPVPSSVVTSIAGAKLGFLPGTLLSATALTLGHSVGFFVARGIGRRGLERFVGEDEVAKASGWLQRRRGALAVAVTRAVPVASEAVILLAGATRAPAARLLLVAGLANLGVAAVYAAIGATAEALGSPLLLLVGSLGLPLIFVVGTAQRRE